ncbi:hypothetical protein EHM69_03910 [candidate division KSB1 bacterium]|nr:MAG: hypothetical protein EHM69_03910 [candidate division KSB1 bacterium]
MSWIWVALVGAVVYLDTTAIAQLMICQPLIACPLWGIIAGRPEIGLFFGITFQLIWLGSLPVGASKFPEGNVGALIAAALAIRFTPDPISGFPWLILLAAALIGIAAAYAGSEVTALIRKSLARVSDRLIAAAEAGRSARFNLLFFGAIGVHALAGFLLTAIFYFTGSLLLARVPQEPFFDSLSGLWPALLGAGAAVIALRFLRKTNLVWFLIALVLSIGGGFLWL